MRIGAEIAALDIASQRIERPGMIGQSLKPALSVLAQRVEIGTGHRLPHALFEVVAQGSDGRRVAGDGGNALFELLAECFERAGLTG